MTEVLNDAQNTCPVHTAENAPAPAPYAAGQSSGAQFSEEGYELNASGVKAAHEYEPLGPDSLTWQIWGTWTGMFQGLWAGDRKSVV